MSIAVFLPSLPSQHDNTYTLDRIEESLVRIFLDLSGRALYGAPYPLSVSAQMLLLISSGSSRYATDFHRVFDNSCSCVSSWWLVSCMIISRKHACSSNTTHVSLTWSCLEKLRWIEKVCWTATPPPTYSLQAGSVTVFHLPWYPSCLVSLQHLWNIAYIIFRKL